MRAFAMVTIGVLVAIAVGIGFTSSRGLDAPVPLATNGVGYLLTLRRDGIEWVSLRSEGGRLVGEFDIWVDGAMCGEKKHPFLPCELHYAPTFTRSGNVLILTVGKAPPDTFTIERDGLLESTNGLPQGTRWLLRRATVHDYQLAVERLRAFLEKLRSSR